MNRNLNPTEFAHIPDIVQADVDELAISSGQGVRMQPSRTPDLSTPPPYGERQGAAWSVWRPEQAAQEGSAEVQTYVPGVESEDEDYPFDAHDLNNIMPPDWDSSTRADYLQIEHGRVGPQGLGQRGWMPPQSGPPSERPWPRRPPVVR